TLSFFISSAAAFNLPGEQADGVYLASIDASGNEVHDLVAPATAHRNAAPFPKTRNNEITARQISARDLPGFTFCGCDFKLNRGDTDAANNDLKIQIGKAKHIEPNSTYYSIRGSVVAFACNEDGSSLQKVWADIITQANVKITADCG
ncbi:hypothetical protein F5883DRAFT_376763, partial [Diaporthe sp. PMI_573]